MPTTPPDLPDDHPTQRRLEALELKVTYLEDLADRLNDEIVRQQQTIERLLAAVQGLSSQVESGAGNTFRSLREELPPHY